MRKAFFFCATLSFLALFGRSEAQAQQYKLRQVTSMVGMKTESTIYVKGPRKRTEGTGLMGIGANQVTIEQCDLRRIIKINDKKKLYYIEPFSKDADEEIDEDAKPTNVKNKPVPPKTVETGGVIHTWYSITDTGERKKMFGLTARHVWTYQKTKPSPDACMMKDSLIMKTDGWYIDLPQFNCPTQYRPNKPVKRVANQPECKDRFVSHRSGKGKLGFPLEETRTVIMGNAAPQTSEFKTSIETLEFSAAKLDSMLFEIPVGYTETKDEDMLQETFDLNAIKKNAAEYKDQLQKAAMSNEQKKPGTLRIGVYEPKTDAPVQASTLQQRLVSSLTANNIDAVAVASEEEAKKFNCDYLLATDVSRVKQVNKIGGILKAIKNTDPTGSTTYAVEAALTLTSIADGSTRTQQKVDGKFEGKIDDAAGKALEEGGRLVLKAIK